jgi:8-oxo-dGTP pyrophosphatase MutT (NUDIX family)
VLASLLFDKTLKPRDAAAAIIVLEDGNYLLQLRDEIPGIFFPGHWGLFGGAMDEGESAEDALRRELCEELGIDFHAITYFTEFAFEFPEHGKILRRFYEVLATPDMVGRMVLAEGADMRAFPASHIMTELRVTPYDSFAIWMHAMQR